MLHEFLRDNRETLIDQCRDRVLERRSPAATPVELEHGIPIFLEQLIQALDAAESQTPERSQEISGPAGGRESHLSPMGLSAGRHGRELLDRGVTIDQVIHDYGDLCQAITQLAIESGAPIAAGEFQTLNRCLDNAIADAVTRFARERDIRIEGRNAHASSERMGVLAHEIRNLLNTAMLAQSAIKAGSVGAQGATSEILDRSLIGLRHLVDRSLSEVRLDRPAAADIERLWLAEFIEDVKVSAILEARARGITFTVPPVDPALCIDADRDGLYAAVGNLLQNAFKFTRPGTEVSLTTAATADEVFIEVRDHCGGLPEHFAARMFEPFTQAGADRSGIGLGLSIARRAVEASHGKLSVSDRPGVGCAFRIVLPRPAVAPQQAVPATDRAFPSPVPR